MNKIEFKTQVLPHLLAIIVFYLVTVVMFHPAIFSNKALNQHDITQWEGSSRELRDFRDQTGEEGLWANSMFSGMPAYLINVEWSDQILTYTKIIGSLGLPHPVRNIFLAFVSFYIMLLTFRVRPLIAIAVAMAFGLSSYMIIGLQAGHNARIGAIAFMPLVIAGIHAVFSRDKKLPGFTLAALGLALHLRENHLQITYYILLISLIYGIIQLISAFKNKAFPQLFKNTAILMLAAMLALGTFSGKFWTTLEYSKYSIRGQSDLSEKMFTESSTGNTDKEGLAKSYAFEYSNGILEPLTLLIPDFFGGASSNILVRDEDSQTLKALRNAPDPNMAQQLVNYTSGYWGEQRSTAPYYTGAIICFLFAIGIVFADRKLAWWLGMTALLGIMLSWGDTFKAFNYFMFDYFPGYNKFRSVTFALLLPLFALPLLGGIGLEKLMQEGLSKANTKKFYYAIGATAGFCLLVVLLAGMASFTKTGEEQLPTWFLKALQSDREALMRSDALRSLAFILAAIAAIWLVVKEKINITVFGFLLVFLVTIDLIVVDKRYLTKEAFVRKSKKAIDANGADNAILNDKDPGYRVYNLFGGWAEARTSYYHSSLGGYHGAKLRRYQELYEHCLLPETSNLIEGLRSGSMEFSQYNTLNMLNAKYLTFGTTEKEVISNNQVYGAAWLSNNIKAVNNADEEMAGTCDLTSKNDAVINTSKFPLSKTTFSASGSVQLTEKQPNYLKYQANISDDGLIVFSEIYYPIGWTASIDGKDTNILQANYALRAIEAPQGDHTIEFHFNPASYRIGDVITLISCILLSLLILFNFYVLWKGYNTPTSPNG
ncbi:MAG: YfhO family protein [Cyclobacteriaceae bacterium]|nr:YfhO family protein [Cyclobacteriaceae bacterium]